MKARVNDVEIELVQGDITEMDTEAIVNAANERLAHGGGVAGAISRKGGPVIQRESDEWVRTYGRVKTGTAAITRGGKLKARWVIHAVGPIMGSGDEDEKLRQATESALALARQRKIKSITFPAISTGIFGFPVDRCADIMLRTAFEHAKNHPVPSLIRFCLWDRKTFDIFAQTLEKLKET